MSGMYMHLKDTTDSRTMLITKQTHCYCNVFINNIVRSFLLYRINYCNSH